jgi:hypothetical protein
MASADTVSGVAGSPVPPGVRQSPLELAAAQHGQFTRIGCRRPRPVLDGKRRQQRRKPRCLPSAATWAQRRPTAATSAWRPGPPGRWMGLVVHKEHDR